VIIAAPDMRRMASFFLSARALPPAVERPLSRRRWAVTTSLVLRTLAVAAFVLMNLHNSQSGRLTYGDLAPRSPLRGIWNVDELTDNGATRPPLTTDLPRWRRVVFD